MNFKTKLLLPAMFIAGIAAVQAENTKPFTVPEVSHWKGGEGNFKPSQGGRIVINSKDPRVAEIARMMRQDYTTMSGTDLPVEQGRIKKGDITLNIKKAKNANPEAYSIQITPDGATVTASDPQGLWWATRTLLQLTENQPDGMWPVGTITDAPEFGLRGFMIDTGRKFIPMDYLRKLVDALAYYKMNTLHVHLNDNGFPYYFDDDWDKTQAAFRLESDKFPGLTARDGSYTKQEFRDFTDYAASKGVEIIPEIDFPAHTLAFTRYLPEIASTGANGRDHMDISNPKTYEFLDTLLSEYLAGPDPVFKSPVFHIGTDEYQGDSITMEQFRAFTDRYIKLTENYGKKPAVWGSLTHAKGQTPVQVDNVLMYGWSNDYSNPKEMLSLGYDMVSIPDRYVYIVPNAGYYYDYLNNELLYNKWTPANIGGMVFSGDTLNQIKGGMFAVWNDHPNNGITTKDIAHRIMAALPTMAAKTWNADKVTVPYEDFIAKSSNMIEAPGVNYLARYGTPGKAEVILEKATVLPGETLPIPEIGYDYTVEFDLTGAEEQKGTKLFESPDAVFWLSDPVSGQMGFSREGHLNTFRQDILPGEKLHVKVTGNNKGTQLYVNGKLVDDLNVRWIRFGDSKRKMAQVRTLVFPLEKAGDFKSKVTNLKVVNAIEK